MPIPVDAANLSTPDIRANTPKKTKVTKAGQRRVSAKIGHMMSAEGKSAREAAGAAYAMEKDHKLQAGGKYIRKAKE
jgi:hypothetical protein